jgi:hypothetical protein
LSRAHALFALVLSLGIVGCKESDPNTKLKPIDPNIPFPTLTEKTMGAPGAKTPPAVNKADKKDAGDKKDPADKTDTAGKKDKQ